VKTIKIRPSVVLTDENKVLLMKYIYGGTTVWGIPGGGVDDAETLVDALKRELGEELGVKIEVDGLLCAVETPAAGKIKHTLHCVFSGKVIGGTPQVNPEHTSALEVEWVSAEEIDDMVLYPPINDVVKQLGDDTLKPRYIGMRARQWF